MTALSLSKYLHNACLSRSQPASSEAISKLLALFYNMSAADLQSKLRLDKTVDNTVLSDLRAVSYFAYDEYTLHSLYRAMILIDLGNRQMMFLLSKLRANVAGFTSCLCPVSKKCYCIIRKIRFVSNLCADANPAMILFFLDYLEINADLTASMSAGWNQLHLDCHFSICSRVDPEHPHNIDLHVATDLIETLVENGIELSADIVRLLLPNTDEISIELIRWLIDFSLGEFYVTYPEEYKKIFDLASEVNRWMLQVFFDYGLRLEGGFVKPNQIVI